MGQIVEGNTREEKVSTLARQLADGFLDCSASDEQNKEIYLFGDESVGEEVGEAMRGYFSSKNIKRPDIKVIVTSGEPGEGYSTDLSWYNVSVKPDEESDSQ